MCFEARNIGDRYNYAIKKIEWLISQQKKVYIQSIALEFALKSDCIKSLVNAVTDLNFEQYIRMRKLVHALYVMLNEGISVTKAAEIAGYADSTNFTRACRRKFGVAPSLITREDLRSYLPAYMDAVKEVSDTIGEKIEMKGGNMQLSRISWLGAIRAA